MNMQQIKQLQRHQNLNSTILQGRCHGSNNSVIVVITDSCPECESYHMDMQALTFAKVGTWVQHLVAVLSGRAALRGSIKGSQECGLSALLAVLMVPLRRCTVCRFPPHCSVV